MSNEKRGKDLTETIDTELGLESMRAPSGVVPELSEMQHKEVARRTRPSAVIVHETVREEGARELPLVCGLGFLLRFKPINSCSSELKLLRIDALNQA